jgi:hypothetical protein
MSEATKTRFRYEQAVLDKRRNVAYGRTRALSITALVFGLASLTPATFLVGIPAIILSVIALKKRQPGRRMAYTGLVTGALGTFVLTFAMLLPIISWQLELHRVALVKQNMHAYRAALDDFATANEGRYPKAAISWEKEDEDGMVLHFKNSVGYLTSIPVNPYTHEQYQRGKDFFYRPEDLAETELNAIVDRTDARCPYVGLAAPGGMPGTIVIMGWSPSELRGSPIEYAVVGYGRNTAEPLHRGANFFVLHN